MIKSHQAPTSRLYRFTLSSYFCKLDEPIKEFQDEVPWCLFFADDIVMVNKTQKVPSKKLDCLREALEKKDFKMIAQKEYLICTFGLET